MKTAFITRIIIDILLTLYVLYYGSIIIDWGIHVIDYLEAGSISIIIGKIIGSAAIIIFFLGLLNLRHSITYIVRKIIFDTIVVKHLIRSSFYLLLVTIPSAIALAIISINRLLFNKTFTQNIDIAFVVFILLFALFIRLSAITIRNGLTLKSENDLTI